jgi:putative peptide zinc metalloprotease protein
MVTMTAPQCSPPKSLAEQLKDVTAVVRTDLHVSRQLQQSTPVYVVHDPVAFRTHQLTLQNYQLLVRLNREKTLGQNFETLVKQQHLDATDEAFFYQLIMQMNQLGIVILPLANGGRLFEQHEKIVHQKRRRRIMGALFMQIPLAHPDEFLRRTASRVQWLFSRAFVCVWALAGLAAMWIIVSRFSEFQLPMNRLLATENLPFLWLSFVFLKVWHELGHGYACRIYGGAVPEMGLLLIAGTPAAYMDATAAWSFPERWKRLVVMMGGMYFESILAIPAVFIWAFSSSPLLSSCAHQIVMMASLITLLFNANPLMKYDGYFIASELLGIQNLRARSDRFLKGLLKRTFLGLKVKSPALTTQEQLLLLVYGCAASIYRVLLVIGIAVMIAQRFPLIGLAVAGFQLVTTVGSSAVQLGVYLLKSTETKAVRKRAAFLAVLALAILPAATFVVPMPFDVVADGVVAAQTEHYLNAGVSGQYVSRAVAAGSTVAEGQLLATLENPDVTGQHQILLATLQEAMLEWEVIRTRNLVEAARYEPRIRELKQQLLETQRQVSALRISAPGQSTVARTLPEAQFGRLVSAGETVAVLVDGDPLIRTWLTEDEFGSIEREPGTPVSCRIPGRWGETYGGTLLRVEPAAESSSLDHALTFIAGGKILMNPQTGLPFEPLFQVDIRPDTNSELRLRDHGMRVSISLPRRYESIASWVFGRVTRFIRRTLMA